MTLLLHLVRRCRRRTSSLFTERDEQTKGTAAKTNMGICALGDDVLCLVFQGLTSPLEPRVAVAFSSASHGLWALTQALRRQLRADHEAATGMASKLQVTEKGGL